MAALESKVADMSVHMAVYNAELNRHIEGVSLARQENAELRKKYEEEIPPLKEFKNRALWSLALLAALGAAVKYAVDLFAQI